MNLGQALENVLLGEKRLLLERHRAGRRNSEEANRCDEELLGHIVYTVYLNLGNIIPYT